MRVSKWIVSTWSSAMVFRAALILLGASEFRQALIPEAHAAPEDRLVKSLSQANPKWRFTNEEHWLVDETARDITEMLAFAAAGKVEALDFAVAPVSDAGETYDLRAKIRGAEVKSRLQWKESIWSPAEYAPWAQHLLTALKLAATKPAPSDSGLLPTLTAPTPQVLQREGKRLSEALTKTPLDASLHEQAALVTAAFALREVAGRHTDVRRENCRITAHLALARALQPQGLSTLGKVAQAALDTLSEREAPALAALDALAHDSTPGVVAWAAALHTRNTMDWRNLGDGATLFEQLENCLARRRAVDIDFAASWLEKAKPAPVHDWRRILIEGDLNVDRGHEFAKESIGQEMNSLVADWNGYFDGQTLTKEGLVKALSEPAARSVEKGADGHDGIRVLGWDLWSAQQQRHLCAAIHSTIYFLRDLWNVPEYKDAQKFIRKELAAMPLLPTLERELSEEPGEIPEISQHVSALITDHPEIITPGVWGYLHQPTRQRQALAIPGPQSWAQPALPFGTTYDMCLRGECIALPQENDRPWWDRAVKLAPYSFDLLTAKLRGKYGNNPPAEVVETTYAPLRAYSLWALREISRSEPEGSPKYLEAMEQTCQLQPDRYFVLGKYYLKASQEEKAAEAFEKGYDQSTNRVRVSNNCEWLVNYLDDHGRKDKALAIAKDGAEVYSFGGLETMAKLQEKHGELKGAEENFKNIAERYENAGPLTAFYRRNQDKDPTFKAILEKAEHDVFPEGLKKVEFAELHDAPEAGAVILGDSPKASSVGLHKDDVIVAVNGYRVANEKQYLYVRGLDDDPVLHIISWNAQGYHDISANVQGRSFGIHFGEYHKQ